MLARIIFSMVSGSIGFTRSTFFPVWWKAIGKPESEPPQGSAMTWELTILASIIGGTFLVLAVRAFGGLALVSGIVAGFFLWLGLITLTSLVNKPFAGHLWAWVLEAGNRLINFLVFGAILGAWHHLVLEREIGESEFQYSRTEVLGGICRHTDFHAS